MIEAVCGLTTSKGLPLQSILNVIETLHLAEEIQTAKVDAGHLCRIYEQQVERLGEEIKTADEIGERSLRELTAASSMRAALLHSAPSTTPHGRSSVDEKGSMPLALYELFGAASFLPPTLDTAEGMNKYASLSQNEHGLSSLHLLRLALKLEVSKCAVI